MRILRHVVSLGLLAWLALPGPAHASGLICVTDPEPGTVARLLARDVTIVRDMDGFLLAVGTEDDLARIRAVGCRAHWIEPETGAPRDEGQARLRFTVTPGAIPGAVDPRLASSGARILHVDPSGIVISATEAEALSIAANGWEIARVFPRAVRLPSPDLGRFRAEEQSRARRLEIDPVVADIVDLVEGPRIDAHVQRLQNFITRFATHDSCFAAADWVADQFRSYGLSDVSFHFFDGQFAPNVVAVLPGSGSSDERIVIGGHYDSVTSTPANCPGADDNASGAAAVLECARILSRFEFDRTIVFLAFGAEEFGLVGSEAYAQEAAMRGDEIVAMVNVDMIGYVAPGDSRDLEVISNLSSSWLRDLVFAVAATYVPELPAIVGTVPSGASSDHASFWSAGYDAVFFFEDSGNFSPYIHSTADVIGVSYNAPALAVGSTRIAAATLATLADPFRVSIAHDPLPDREESVPALVTATVRAAGELDPDGLFLHYATGGADQRVPLEASGVPHGYRAWIPAQPPGTFVEYYLSASDTEGNVATHPQDAPNSTHRFFVGRTEIVAADDFELDRGWTVGAPEDDATSGVWARVDPVGTWSGEVPVQPEDDHTPAPGVRCYITGNGLPGGDQGDDDVDNGRTTLISPNADLHGALAGWLRYRRWYSNDTGANPGTDSFVVDASSDGGVTWHRIETTAHSLRDWAPVDVELSRFLDLSATMRFRFIAGDDPPGSVVEAGIDDFEVHAFFPDATHIASGSAPSAIHLQPWPNPFRSDLEIRFQAGAPDTRVELDIYDAGGRLVRARLPAPRDGPDGMLRWDGLDLRGEPAPSGVYFLRLRAGEQTRTAHVLRIR